MNLSWFPLGVKKIHLRIILNLVHNSFLGSLPSCDCLAPVPTICALFQLPSLVKFLNKYTSTKLQHTLFKKLLCFESLFLKGLRLNYRRRWTFERYSFVTTLSGVHVQWQLTPRLPLFFGKPLGKFSRHCRSTQLIRFHTCHLFQSKYNI